MSYKAYAEICVDLANQFHRSAIMFEVESNKLGVKMPREFRYAMFDLRMAMLRARDELRYMTGQAVDDRKSDPNGEVTHEISRGM
jgi:hypothetical protein